MYQKTAAYGHFGRPEFPWEVPKTLEIWTCSYPSWDMVVCWALSFVMEDGIFFFQILLHWWFFNLDLCFGVVAGAHISKTITVLVTISLALSGGLVWRRVVLLVQTVIVPCCYLFSASTCLSKIHSTQKQDILARFLSRGVLVWSLILIQFSCWISYVCKHDTFLVTSLLIYTFLFVTSKSQLLFF